MPTNYLVKLLRDKLVGALVGAPPKLVGVLVGALMGTAPKLVGALVGSALNYYYYDDGWMGGRGGSAAWKP